MTSIDDYLRKRDEYNRAHCKNCGRERKMITNPWPGSAKPPVAIEVVHDYYGCDTGCCGHRIIFVDEDGKEVVSHWTFSHEGAPGQLEDGKEEARVHGLPITKDESMDD